MAQRNKLVDVLKCLACFFVVMLHYPTKEYQTEIDILQNVIGRCGVPVFFMISGYFAAKRVEGSDGKGNKWFFRQGFKMLMYFVVFSAIMYVFYFMYDLAFAKAKPTISVAITFNSIIKAVVFNQPFWGGILWYLLAFAYCLFIYGAASYFKHGYNVLICLTPLLLIGYHLFGRYSLTFFDRDIPFYYASNFLFAAVPMFTLGFIMPRIKGKAFTNVNLMIFAVIAFLLLYAEGAAFYANGKLNSNRNNYLFNVVLAFVAVYYVTNDPGIKIKDDNVLSVIGRKYSLYIYAFQGISDTLWHIVLKLASGYRFYPLLTSFFKYSKPLSVFFLSLLLAFVYVKIADLIKNIPKRISNRRHTDTTSSAA